MELVFIIILYLINKVIIFYANSRISNENKKEAINRGEVVYRNAKGELRMVSNNLRVREFIEPNVDHGYIYIEDDRNGQIAYSKLAEDRKKWLKEALRKREKLGYDTTTVKWEYRNRIESRYTKVPQGVRYKSLDSDQLYVVREINDCYFYLNVDTYMLERRSDGEISYERGCLVNETPYPNADWKERMDKYNEKTLQEIELFKGADREYHYSYGGFGGLIKDRCDVDCFFPPYVKNREDRSEFIDKFLLYVNGELK